MLLKEETQCLNEMEPAPMGKDKQQAGELVVVRLMDSLWPLIAALKKIKHFGCGWGHTLRPC